MSLSIPVDETDHAQGRADAPVTLVEYGDYECPHCANAHPMIKAVQAEMGDDLRFVFRNFPLAQIHEHARLAAQAAEAAGAQSEEAFWRMHDTLFVYQDNLELPDLISYAKSLNLDIPRFQQDLESGAFLLRVQHDFRGGVRSGVNGTPTFFINGLRYDGAFKAKDLLAALRTQ